MEKRINNVGNFKEVMLKAGVLLFLVFAAIMLCRSNQISAKAKDYPKKRLEGRIEKLGTEIKEIEEKIATTNNKKQLTKLKKELESKKTELEECNIALVAEFSADITEYIVTLNDTFTPEYEFPDKKHNVLEWSSSDDSIVKVSENGEITAVGYGSAKVTVKSSISKKKLTLKVNVYKAAESVTVEDEVLIKYSKNSIFKIPFETDPVGAYVTIKAVPEKEGGKDAVVVSTKDCTDSEIAVKVKSCGTEYLELRDYKGDLLKKITVYVYKPLSVLKFRYVDYAVARGDWTCTFKLITKPAKANEKIELVYDDELVTITEIGYGEYKAELLKDTKVTITAVTKSGLEATTELVPVDPGNDDDDDDDNTEDDYTEDNLED